MSLFRTDDDFLEEGQEIYDKVEHLLAKISKDSTSAVAQPRREYVQDEQEEQREWRRRAERSKEEEEEELIEQELPLQSMAIEYEEGFVNEEEDDHVLFARCLGRNEMEYNLGTAESVEKYFEVCKAKVQRLLQQMGPEDEAQARRLAFSAERLAERERVKRLKEERDTWKLLAMLHQCLKEGPAVEDELPTYLPQIEFDRKFVSKHERVVQVWNVVAGWFHSIAQIDADRQPRSGSRLYLAKTVSSLTQHMGSSSQRVRLVQTVDPDSTLREGQAALHQDDQDDQVTLLEELLKLIKQGAFYNESKHGIDQGDNLCTQAMRLCEEYGQPWRAASLCGGRPANPRDGDLDGNVYRALWKTACISLAQRMLQQVQNNPESKSSASRAAALENLIYSLLGGDLEMVLASPLCRTWKDRCWASFRCMVEAKLDAVCNSSRNKFQQLVGHIPGPSAPEYEDDVTTRAILALQQSAQGVFESVESIVPEPERPFFTVQKSFILGNFRDLLSGRLMHTPSLCEFYCGPAWDQLADIMVAQVCGYEAAPEQPFPDRSLLQLPLHVAPCWKVGNRAFTVQFLRFLAHSSSYMCFLSSVSSPVVETSPADNSIMVSFVVAYLRFLLSDPTNILRRYIIIPVFYQVLKDRHDVCLAAQAAMFEAAAVSSDSERSKLSDRWRSDQCIPKSLYFRSMTQSFRNVMRQWLEGEVPCEMVKSALQEFMNSKMSNDSSLPSDQWESSPSTEQMLDIRLRALSTWEWMDKEREILPETLVQGNTILRELVFDEFFTESNSSRTQLYDQRTSSIELAKNFLKDDLLRLHGALNSLLPQQFFKLSRQTRAQIERECSMWKFYFAADNAIQTWDFGVNWIAKAPRDVFDREDLPEKIYRTAIETSERIWDVLDFSDGFLVDFHDEEAEDFVYNDQQALELDSHAIDKEEERRTSLLGKSAEEPGVLRTTCVRKLVRKYLEVVKNGFEILMRFNTSHDMAYELLQRGVAIASLLAKDSVHLRCCIGKEEMKVILETIRQFGKDLLRLQLTSARTLDDWILF